MSSLSKRGRTEEQNSMNMQDKTVIITGGSRGMGQRLALKLGAGRRKRGRQLPPGRRRAAKARSPRSSRSGGTALAVQADVADTESVESLVDQSVERFGSLDVVVANAAASAFKPLSQIYGRSRREDHEPHRPGLPRPGPARPHMNEGGRVMAVSGWDSFRVLPGHGLLGAAKAAMETIVKYLAIELAKDKITTVGVCPGPDRHRLLPLLRR